MRDSGTVLEWDLGRPVLDKHSTGGVGDKVSLMLAPVVAACGGAVPMISGRGLGHTGGTLDKLDSIPGYDSTPDLETLRRVVGEAGCAIVGQTAELAPADRRLYAVRDATGTVESIPLIVASILSKKLAAGPRRAGDGRQVRLRARSWPAARRPRSWRAALVEVAGGAGLPTVALLTDMDQPLGTTAGNALEVREAIDYLSGGEREPRLHEVTMALAASLLVQGGLAGTEDDARERAERALASGAAAERFAHMVSGAGRPGRSARATRRATSPPRPSSAPSTPERAGVLAAIDCRAVGLVVTGLGGNRAREDDVIDPAVGLDARSRRWAPRSARTARSRSCTRATRRGADAAAAELRAAVTGRRGAARAGRRRRVAGRSRVIPKAELHVHLEGTAPPALVRRLAERNGMALPGGPARATRTRSTGRTSCTSSPPTTSPRA